MGTHPERWSMAMTTEQKERYVAGAEKLNVSIAEFMRMGADGLAEAVLDEGMDPRGIARKKAHERLEDVHVEAE